MIVYSGSIIYCTSISLLYTLYIPYYILFTLHHILYLYTILFTGGGFMSSWEALRTLNNLGLRARRTIRAVVWVNEENGDAGESIL